MKKLIFGAVLLAAVISCASTVKETNIDTGKEVTKIESKWENLKVLPQDISEEDLKAVMREFNMSLGVKCNHCHAPNAEGKMDFASDAKKEKEYARSMMKMTAEINKNHFDYDASDKKKVSCYTCHQGNVKPTKISDLAPAAKPGQTPQAPIKA